MSSCLVNLRREPTILGLDIEGNVAPRVKDIETLLPGQNITMIVHKAPRLLTSDVSGVASKLASLRWLLGPKADLPKIIRRSPALLLSNVENTVATKFRKLEELFPSADVVKMVEKDATVLFYDFENTLQMKVECWRKRVTNATEMDNLIVQYPLLLSYSLDTSVSRLDYIIQVMICIHRK
ncbi:unnamed protein product [Choristocarpus tenellus]